MLVFEECLEKVRECMKEYAKLKPNDSLALSHQRNAAPILCERGVRAAANYFFDHTMSGGLDDLVVGEVAYMLGWRSSKGDFDPDLYYGGGGACEQIIAEMMGLA